MDDTTGSRVFEPLDLNSISLISSTSSTNNRTTTNNNSFMSNLASKPSTPTLLSRDDENNTPLKWQFDKKEFRFQSNSTPSKKTPKLHHEQLLNVRKRRAQLIGAKPKVQSKLNQSTSKLDLLEDDKITSLPLVPPIDINKDSRILSDDETNERTTIKRHKLNPVNELRIHHNKINRYISYGSSTEIENDQPIILVEDYIPQVDENRAITKKRVSMSDLKRKMNARNDNHLPVKRKTFKNEAIAEEDCEPMALRAYIFDEESDNEGLNDSIRSIPLNSIMKSIIDTCNNTHADFGDKYLAEMTVKSQIKQCIVCERPLYELSSLMKHQVLDYKEIVCENCTVKYEEAAKFFEDYEFETSVDDSNNESMLSCIDSSVGPYLPNNIVSNSMGSSYENDKAYSKNLKHERDQFSNELIRTLRLQLHEEPCQNGTTIKNNKAYSSPKSMNWFLEARRKIKWRWQVNGFLPFFLRENDHNKTCEGSSENKK
ncbi:hypothetical protein KAFR_0G01480 [Kazachstania africana CBS 2517]|uniref:Uncharacterized protein n=1 Tax=Kazachstania africana (strain ATCC 22294 / BCRC 22015 / CBS 2517 / CECT 1963 / NBRC 1671 / NRRL Y-8276) TaxID=1071382 RepID=H2AXT2_KAZAF|nr:hypothetical protein KAFR_0G01480 [Kazachstania africana CBS 2517]CCF59182.1 hypothetical protein KAFR_0G01480 [Kazachstania africana CBS 2517]